MDNKERERIERISNYDNHLGNISAITAVVFGGLLFVVAILMFVISPGQEALALMIFLAIIANFVGLFVIGFVEKRNTWRLAVKLKDEIISAKAEIKAEIRKKKK